MLRVGAVRGPCNATKMVGCAPAASPGPDSASRTSIDPSVRSSVPATDSVAVLALGGDVVEAQLAGGDRHGGLRGVQRDNGPPSRDFPPVRKYGLARSAPALINRAVTASNVREIKATIWPSVSTIFPSPSAIQRERPDLSRYLPVPPLSRAIRCGQPRAIAPRRRHSSAKSWLGWSSQFQQYEMKFFRKDVIGLSRETSIGLSGETSVPPRKIAASLAGRGPPARARRQRLPAPVHPCRDAHWRSVHAPKAAAAGPHVRA